MEKRKSWLSENFYILVALYAVSLFLSNDIFLPAIDTVALDLHASKSLVSTGVGLFILGSLVFQLVAGPISDRYGRRKSLLYGGLFFTLATLGTALSNSISLFLFFRFLAGVSTCMFSAAGVAAINEYYHETKVVKAVSLTINVILLSPILGPIAGAEIIKFTSWRGVFFADMIFTACILTLIFIFMPETSNREKVVSLKQNFKGLFAVAKNKKFIVHCCSLASYAAITGVWITAGPDMFMGNLGFSAQVYSWIQAPILIFYIIGNTLAPTFVHRIGSHKVVMSASKWMFTFAIILIAGNLIFGNSVYLLLFSVSSVMFIRGCLVSPYSQSTLALQKAYHGSSAAVLFTINNTFMFTASFLASAMYGFSNKSYILVILGFCLVGVLFTFIAVKKIKTTEKFPNKI